MEPMDPLEQFQTLSVIGRGAYAKVILVRKKINGKLYALKSMKKKYIQKKKHQDRIIIEKDILVETRHPFLVSLSSCFQNEQKLFLVLEYCPGGELFALLSKKKKFSEQQARFYTSQVILALQYLHQKDIIYRDLKPENILIDSQGYVKLTDFGLSSNKVVGDRERYSVTGTPEYMAPEIVKKEGHGKAVDWWCLGSMIYEMLNGVPPFYCKNRSQMFDNIKLNQPIYQKNWSNYVKDLLKRLFAKNPQERLQNIINIRTHPWFATVDFDKLINRQQKAPFIPIIKNELDVSNFNRQFTEQEIESCCSSMSDVNTLEGFSYQKSPLLTGKSPILSTHSLEFNLRASNSQKHDLEQLQQLVLDIKIQ